LAQIELVHITRRFGNVVANDDVSLDICAGEIHALLGENGAGKTTLMNILYGLYRPNSGRIVIDGEPVEIESPYDAITHGIGMVHQHFMLVPTLNQTVADEPRRATLLSLFQVCVIPTTPEPPLRPGGGSRAASGARGSQMEKTNRFSPLRNCQRICCAGESQQLKFYAGCEGN